MKKKYRILSLILVMYIAMSSVCFAVDSSNISVMAESDAFDEITHISDFNFQTGLVKYGADVIALPGATSSYVSCVIQQDVNGSYQNVPGTWISQSKPGRYASVSNQWYVYKGYWYRTQATYIVHINGQEYKIVKNSDQYWYN